MNEIIQSIADWLTHSHGISLFGWIWIPIIIVQVVLFICFIALITDAATSSRYDDPY